MGLFERLSLATRPPKFIRRLIVAVIGFTVLLIGIALIILPGPATLVIPLGLLILATEFVWARRLLKKFKETVKNLNNRGKKTDSGKDGDEKSGA